MPFHSIVLCIKCNIYLSLFHKITDPGKKETFSKDLDEFVNDPKKEEPIEPIINVVSTTTEQHEKKEKPKKQQQQQ
jgi:hypothetical protein